MDRNQAMDAIKARWREFYPADRKGGIICPLCGSGSGKHGSGLCEVPNSRSHLLKCFNGACQLAEAHGARSIIDVYMIDHGMNPETDLKQALDEMAGFLGLKLDAPAPKRTTPQEDFSDTTFTGSAPAEEPTAQADYTSYYAECKERFDTSPEAQEYLRQRGIMSAAIPAYYGIGFDPAWISPTVIKNMTAQGKTWRPEPKPVLIMPTCKTHYVARDIRPANQLDEQQRSFAKMNEGKPGIFGFNELKRDIIEIAFVTEGIFDALSIIEAGATPKAGATAIALNSTANVDLLLKKLESTPTKATLVISLDNDEAGKKAAVRLKDGLKRLNISFIQANLSGQYKDPNEYLCNDREGFIQAVERATAQTSAKPDNTSLYIDTLMAGEVERFKQSQNRKTGFANLDEKAGGLNAGLYVLAAISSLGKTTFCLQLADNIAASGNDVILFSMEQSRLEMVTKSLARLTAQADQETAVTSLQIRNGYTPLQVIEATKRYKEQIGQRLSIVECNYYADIGFISDYIRHYINKNGTAPTVIVDYLQVLQPSTDGKARASKKDEIDLAMIELKRLSRELELTIIVISSINRANYMQPFAFESLKESGNIEFGADVVWGLQLACLDEELFNKADSNIKAKRQRINEAKAENPRKIKFVCIKNRFGIANYECHFDYFPRHDMFIPTAQAPASGVKKAGKIATAGGGRK